MAFKTLMKRQARMMSPKTIRFIKNGKVIISRDLRKHFIKNNYVEVLVDEDYNKLALKPTNDERRGYKIFPSGVFQCNLLKKGGIAGDFKVRFTEGKIIIDDVNVEKLKQMEYWDD